MNSQHKVEVVKLVLDKHPNADILSIARVYGFTVCTGTEQWAGKDRAAYIPPDTLVDTRRSEFDWLASEKSKYNAKCEKMPKDGDNTAFPYALVRAKKLRGVLSYGLLVPAPEGSNIGDDVATTLGCIHYNAPESEAGAEATTPPKVYSPCYDVESFQRHALELFTPGEPVFATEKVHGENGRWVYDGQTFHAGSRTEWKKAYIPNDSNGLHYETSWWKALRNTPELADWLKQHPNVVVYGEVYGKASLKYGLTNGDVRIAVFDIMDHGKWIDAEAARLAAPELPWVPMIARELPFDFDKLMELAEGDSLIPGANHYREGIVVKPMHERESDNIGRVHLKIISPSYLQGKKG